MLHMLSTSLAVLASNFPQRTRGQPGAHTSHTLIPVHKTTKPGLSRPKMIIILWTKPLILRVIFCKAQLQQQWTEIQNSAVI